jgi:fructan beta-fructosidase
MKHRRRPLGTAPSRTIRVGKGLVTLGVGTLLVAGMAIAAPAAAAPGAAAPAALAQPAASAVSAPEPPVEPYRPYLGYSPEKNWMNDPNGLVFYEGTYHLFYQYNPFGTTWGNMSWGHATSTDLLHWTEQPLAIPQDADADIFSGSIVVDHDNTSGFGTAENPPLVAMYTAAYKTGEQAQALAYSTDAGQTWTKYAGNPVLDRDSNNFRDPHMFWYDGGSPENSYWVVVTVEATEHTVLLYRSDDLIDWTYLSDFGPANATGGVWECPDLFPLPVDGDSGDVAWVMVVNINPGGVSGGSGGQYFVGDFDGTTFTSESTVGSGSLPEGTTFAGFDGGDYEGWTVENSSSAEPFGTAPAIGTVPGQQTVTGYAGPGLINGFLGFDAPTGSVTSPSFTIDQDYINFLVGGGNHPHIDGGQSTNDPPAGSELLFDGFEYPDGQNVADNGWTLSGDFEAARNPSTSGGDYYIGQKRINTFDGGPKGDDNIGTLTSPAFTIDKPYLSMLVGGGFRDPGATTLAVELVIDGQVVATTAGKNDGLLNWSAWDVSSHLGQTATIVVDDQATGGWGHLTLDHVVLADTPAKIRSSETSVNLIVDGETVRSSTGGNSENLDWASWNVADLVGSTAQISVVDNNTAGWGHVLADQFMFADQPAQPRIESYDWLDWGRDYYAGVTYDNAPDGKRIMIAWMNNWDYANQIPTGQWRSAMALPRELSLQTIDGRPRLVSQVVDQAASLEKLFAAVTVPPGAIAEGSTALPVQDVGNVYKVDAVLAPGTASAFGLALRASADGSQQTPLIYDTEAGTLTLDRRTSGDVGFSPSFASEETAPVALEDGKLHLEVYVDNASVQAFSQGGTTTITDQIFPDPSSSGISLVSEGGSAVVESLTITPLYGAMYDSQPVLVPPGAPTEGGATSTEPGTATVTAVQAPGGAPTATTAGTQAALAFTGLPSGYLLLGALLLVAGGAAVRLRRRGRTR